MNKIKLRKSLINKRNSLTDKEVSLYSKDICSQLIDLIEGDTVLVYLAKDNEVDLNDFILCLRAENRRICIPLCGKNGYMDAVLLKEDTVLLRNSFGILEPAGDYEVIDPSDLDAVIVPGTGFDVKGNRIGFGGGFYDRYLPRTEKSCFKCAVCFSCQLVVDAMPESHDYPVDAVISERSSL